MSTLTILHLISGLIVLAEALNKLERTDPLAKGIGLRARAVVWMKAAAWMLLAIGAGGAIVSPMLHLDAPSVQDMCVLSGFAILVVRSRLKEVPPGEKKPESDDFSKTTVLHAREFDKDARKTRKHLQPAYDAGRELAEDIRERA